MEQRASDPHLKAILNSPVKSTPAVPVPDWSQPVAATPTSISVPQISKSASTINVVVPGSSATDPQTNITLQNCVATMDLGVQLNLTVINSRTRNSEYNPARFTGVVMRIREPRSTALIFKSGKIVCTGARNEEDALLASKKFARIIEKLGFKIQIKSFRVENIVATCDLRFPIKLENLNHMHGQFSRYEPELFPALVYRMVKPRLVMLIFVNGKIVFTGAKRRTEIEEALCQIYPILRSFRKN